MDYDNTNTGVLFKNESANEKAPAYKGKINVNGTDYQLAAWIKEAKSGKGKFMSLKIEPMRDSKPQPKPQKQEGFDDLNDDVPW
jgi:hypothetical protein